ncbi:MAG: MATE family efflux transporter [Ruminococcaceae bacterium]|nr:MATE family efflux transporter [Oscillospiraceae bacterium]
MLTGILQLAFNAADIIIVGQAAGSDAVGQVGATNSIINLIVNMFIGFSVGVSVSVSREYGAGNHQNVNKLVHTAVATAIVGGIVCSIIGFFGARYFLTLMQTDLIHIDGSTLYMKIYFLSMPASMMYNFCSAILRALGNSKTPLVILTSAGVVNVIFNLFFVYAFGMAVEGVALATVISQYVAMVWILIYLTKAEGPHKLNLKKVSFDQKSLKSIIVIGFPAGIYGSLFSLSNVVIQSSVNSFGNIVVNGNAAAASIEGFIYTASNSFHQAAITFIGQNRGAGKYDRILKSLGVCVIYSFVFEVILAFITYTFGELLLGIYIKDSSAAIMTGIIRISVIGIPHFLCGIMDVVNGALRGLGASTSPTVISLICACGFRIVWIYTIFERYKTISMLYLVYPISWGVSTVFLTALFFALYFSKLKKFKKLSAENAVNTL